MTKDRSLIESKYKWKIDLMYNSKESIDKDIEKVKSYINEIKEYKGKLELKKIYIKHLIYQKKHQEYYKTYMCIHI